MQLIFVFLTVVAGLPFELNTTFLSNSTVPDIGMKSASKNDVVHMLRDFARKFPADSSDTCGAPALTCTRQYCHNTSGLYDTPDAISVNCAAMATWLEDISNNCCTANVMQSRGIAGQQFSLSGWNVAIAYANCHHDADIDRPGDFQRWGPNGVCLGGE